MKRFLFFALLLTVSFSYGQTDTLVKWTFPNNPDDSVADGGLTMNSGSYIRCMGGTSAMNFTNTGATTYSARTTGWDSGNGVKYWEVFFSTTSYSAITLSSKQRSSATGPRDFKVQYRLSVLDAWTDVPSASVLDSNDWTHGLLTDVPLPVSCEDQDTVFLNWIMTSDVSVSGVTVANAGASRIDDIIVTGTGTSTPVKLAVTSVNGGADPFVNTGFYAVIRSLDASDIPANAAANVNFTLSLATGTGILSGTLTGTIPAGTSTDTVFGILYNTVESGVSITATDDASVLAAGTSANFTVQDLPPTAVKLSVSSVNSGADPYVGFPFNATIQSLDNASNPVNVVADVNFTLSSLYGTGVLGGTVTGTIASGTSGVTVTGITYNVAENNIALKVVDDAAVLEADTSVLFNVLALPATPDIVITEIMYNPPESGTDSLEFIEIYNNDVTAVPLSGLFFTSGISHIFADDTLQPGDYYVLCVDSAAFYNFFGVTGHEWNSGSLNNSGEGLAIEDSFGNLVDTVFFDDAAPWPTAADGNGPSLVLCDPSLDNNNGANWFAAAEFVGNLDTIAVYANPETGCITTDISNPVSDDNQVNCYPNPADDYIMISAGTDESEVTIFDILGNTVFHSNCTSSLIKVNTAEFCRGIYFISIYTDGRMVSKKISVE